MWQVLQLISNVSLCGASTADPKTGAANKQSSIIEIKFAMFALWVLIPACVAKNIPIFRVT